MSGMEYEDYRAMIEDTPVSSRTVEFRDKAGRLAGVMLMDRMEESLSAVYSFFKTTVSERSLGTFMILWMVEQAHSLNLPHVYLGYWINGSEKMAYKTRFQPLETLGQNGWKVQKNKEKSLFQLSYHARQSAINEFIWVVIHNCQTYYFLENRALQSGQPANAFQYKP